MKTIEILREQGFVELNEYALNLYSVSDEAVIRIEDLFHIIYDAEEDADEAHVILTFNGYTSAWFTVNHPELVNWEVFRGVLESIIISAKNFESITSRIESKIKIALRAYGYELKGVCCR